jgi:acetyl esterase/lipase
VLERRYSNQLAVTAKTPATFLFATTNDPTVPIVNSVDFYRALQQAKVPAELHVYDFANHGCGLCGSIIPLSTWPALLRNWLVQRGWIPATAPPPPAPGPNLPSWIPGLTGPGSYSQ